MTLLAHRGSYKTTCLAFAMAVMLVIYPKRNLIFMRKTDDDVVEIIRQVKLILQSDAMQHLTSRIYGSPVQLLKSDMFTVNTDCYAALPGLLNASRKKRIAAGSGTAVVDVNRLLKQYEALQQMTKMMSGKNMKKLQKKMGMMGGGFPGMGGGGFPF